MAASKQPSSDLRPALPGNGPRAADPTPSISPQGVRALLVSRREIALLDLREEDVFAQAHPLFAAQMPPDRIAVEAPERIPRRNATLVLYDDGEGLVAPAAERLRGLGYGDVRALAGGLDGWRAAGYELFRDVNSYSKAFGELVEVRRHTPSLPAGEVNALIEAKADIAVLDARRFEEYQTMSIPTGTSVPGSGPPPRAVRGGYRRPYEGTGNPAEAMQAYLDWEDGLVEQLARDGSHGFFVI